jgi:hypothetical protein
MMELDDETVRTTALNHPAEHRKKFLMAYECFVMWLIKSNVERNQSQEFVKQLVVVLRDNIRRLGQYEEGVFEEIWEALQDAMPNSLTPGEQTGVPAPWTHVVTACNARGIELSHTVDFMFMTHIMMMFKHMREFVEMTP